MGALSVQSNTTNALSVRSINFYLSTHAYRIVLLAHILIKQRAYASHVCHRARLVRMRILAKVVSTVICFIDSHKKINVFKDLIVQIIIISMCKTMFVSLCVQTSCMYPILRRLARKSVLKTKYHTI